MGAIAVHIDAPPRRHRAAFTLTPLADVMFQLLIFFMLSTSLAPYALIPLGGGAAPPALGATDARASGTPPPSIWRLSEGRVRIGGETVSFEDLPAYAAQARADGIPEIVLLASRAATVQDVASALEILRAARVLRVRLIGRGEGYPMAFHSHLAPKDRRKTPDFGLAQVNIVLLLVLFFLVTGTLVESEEQSVDLPETLDLPFERLPRPLLVVQPNGAWTLDGTDVTPTSLAEAVANLDADLGSTAPVHLLAPGSASAEILLAAMDALQPTGRAVMMVTITLAGQTP